jgi:hypothetical protein
MYSKEQDIKFAQTEVMTKFRKDFARNFKLKRGKLRILVEASIKS